MIKLKKILTDKAGLAAPLACAIVLALVVIMSGATEYLRLQIIANDVRDALQSAVTSVATQNYSKVYSGLREGYAGGYEMSPENIWNGSTDTGNVLENLENTLELSSSGSYLLKMTGSKLEYKLYDMSISIINVPFAPGVADNANKFTVNVKITLEVPVYFGGVELFPMKIILNVKAGYTSKFG